MKSHCDHNKWRRNMKKMVQNKSSTCMCNTHISDAHVSPLRSLRSIRLNASHCCPPMKESLIYVIASLNTTVTDSPPTGMLEVAICSSDMRSPPGAEVDITKATDPFLNHLNMFLCGFVFVCVFQYRCEAERTKHKKQNV